jgi:TusA-related sulfurtransferase
MNVRVGDKVECLYHMSNRGEVLRVYYTEPTAENNAGPFMKMTRIVFLSEMDGKEYDMLAKELRKVRE